MRGSAFSAACIFSESRRSAWAVIRADDAAGLVVHGEHQPATIGPAQVGFVSPRGEVHGDVIGSVVAAGLLELRYLVFPGGVIAVLPALALVAR